MYISDRDAMNYMIRSRQNLQMCPHLFDVEKDKNYCIAFFQAEDVESSAKVPTHYLVCMLWLSDECAGVAQLVDRVNIKL
jgi:hypothetical protein